MKPRSMLAPLIAMCVGAMGLGAHAATPGDYVYAGSFDLGAPGGWDYVSFEAGRLYVGHVGKVDAVDVATGKVVGSVSPMNEAHGAAIDSALGRGFATSGGDGLLKEFDLADLHIVKEIPVAPDADGVIFDPGTGNVIVAVGDGKSLAIVDAKSATVSHTIALPGQPEFLATDGHGKAFVNITDSGQMARIDLASGKIEATWPLTGCKGPHGVAFDSHTNRLFVGCSNSVVLALDTAGKVLATMPAGIFNDAIVVDERRGRVFCPNGDGTLTVISEGAGDHYSVLRTIPTFLGARTMAIDPKTGDLYLLYGNIMIASGPRDPGGLKFAWNAAKVAVFKPND